ncbi:MAG: helix-turn-helix domain-containing protein [Chloroflexota bacterium]
MDELGIILRDAREMKGLTLVEVQEQTRISARYLEAMESGEYHLLPTPVHVRGFLRNYARFLDLDPEPLVERYEANESTRSRVTASPSTENGDGLTTRNDQPFFNPVNVDLEGNADGAESRVRLVIIVALLITIGLAASRFLPGITGNGDGGENLPAMIESLMSQEAEPAADVAPDGTTTPEATETVEVTIIPSERNDPIGAATDEAAGPVPTQPPLPATMDRINLRLDITERTWVRVTIDGEVVLEDQVTREDGPFEWEAEQEAHLRTGNAAGVFININDVDIGKLGGRGEVAEQTWTTTTTGN